MNPRHHDTGVLRRTYPVHERGNKSTRGIRTTRSTNIQKSTSPTTYEEERFGFNDCNSSQHIDRSSSTNKQLKKDLHRHSLDGYDLNNIAGNVYNRMIELFFIFSYSGVVKIETLPASALEEESAAFDDGGEGFCVVMSKRGRKEQKAAQLSKQNATEVPAEQPSKPSSIDTDDPANNEVNSSSSTH